MKRTNLEIERSAAISAAISEEKAKLSGKTKGSILKRSRIARARQFTKNLNVIQQAGKVCSLENVNEETEKDICKILDYLEEYARYLCGARKRPDVPALFAFVKDGKSRLSQDILMSGFLKRGGLVNARSRGDVFDELVSMVNTEIVELFEAGCDENQLFPVTFCDKYGRVTVKMKKAAHATRGIILGCAAKLLRSVSASVDLNSVSEGAFARYVDVDGNDRDPDCSEKAERVLSSFPIQDQQVIRFAIDASKQSRKLPSMFTIASTTNRKHSTVKRIVGEYVKAMTK